MPRKSEGRSDMHLPSLANIGVTWRCHSIILMCQCTCRRNCKLAACQGMLLHGCHGRFTSWLTNIWYVQDHVVCKLWYVCKRIDKYHKACKHMICLQAYGWQRYQTRLQRKLQTGCLPRHAVAWVPRRVHELACNHMICLQARGLRTMIWLQMNQQGFWGLQTRDMFSSTWLAKISYDSKPHKIIPFLFVGIGPLHGAQIGIHMIR